MLKATTAIFSLHIDSKNNLKVNRTDAGFPGAEIFNNRISILLIIFFHTEHGLPETSRKKKSGGKNLRKNCSSIRETEQRQAANTATFPNSKQNIISNKSNCENGRNRFIFSHFSM